MNSEDTTKSIIEGEGDEICVINVPSLHQIPEGKRAKFCPLHERNVAPHSFLVEGFEKSIEKSYFEGKTFGVQKEAYVRDAYIDILKLVNARWHKSARMGHPAMLAIIRGSSGVGKSVFLAYAIATYRQSNLENMALFHAQPFLKSSTGRIFMDEIVCSVWLGGKRIINGDYKTVRQTVKENLSKVDMIVMDGCSMHIDLSDAGFKGLILVAASPSLYVKNLQDGIPTNHFSFTMPPIPNEEAFMMADIIGVDRSIIEENFTYMNGVGRYLFKKGDARREVTEAITMVSASSISTMVSMQSTNVQEEQLAVHALILWKVSDKNYTEYPIFTLVSQYAEHLVAKQLVKEETNKLRDAMQALQPLSGAEGYAGALFEAYAVRSLQSGGTFEYRELDDANINIMEDGGKFRRNVTCQDKNSLSLMKMETEPIEIESNKLDIFNIEQLSLDDGQPRLLWPSVRNFPTFDCIYIYADKSVLLL